MCRSCWKIVIRIKGADLKVNELLAAIREKGAPLLSSVKVIDYYQGEQISSGFIGLTISCVYRQEGRTLTEDEVTPLHNAVCSLLQVDFGIKIR